MFRFELLATHGKLRRGRCHTAHGAFETPCGWHEKPIEVDLDESRLWSWRDPQLLRCLRAGPRPFELLGATSGADE